MEDTDARSAEEVAGRLEDALGVLEDCLDELDGIHEILMPKWTHTELERRRKVLNAGKDVLNLY